MFPLRRATPETMWKAIEDDFVLGACSRRILGYASRDVDRIWTAFDDDARALGRFLRLGDAKAALWAAHRDEHDTVCATPHDRGVPQRPSSERDVADRSVPTVPRDAPSRASW